MGLEYEQPGSSMTRKNGRERQCNSPLPSPDSGYVWAGDSTPCSRGTSLSSVTSDGRCLIWGYIDKHNGFKLSREQISDQSLVMSDDLGRPRILLQPVAVPNIGEAAYVSCSRSHTIFVNREGRAFAAGFGDEGQLGNGTECDNDVAKTVEGLDGAHIIWGGTGGTFSMVAAPFTQSKMMLDNGTS